MVGSESKIKESGYEAWAAIPVSYAHGLVRAGTPGMDRKRRIKDGSEESKCGAPRDFKGVALSNEVPLPETETLGKKQWMRKI